MLKRVKIQGFKSLADVEVHLQPLSVFFGPNASGKSNFLDALQLLSRMTTSNRLKDAFEPPYRGISLESFTFGQKGIESLLMQEKAAFVIEVDVEISQTTTDAIKNTMQLLKGVEVKEYIRQKYLRYRIEIEMLPQ